MIGKEDIRKAALSVLEAMGETEESLREGFEAGRPSPGISKEQIQSMGVEWEALDALMHNASMMAAMKSLIEGRDPINVIGDTVGQAFLAGVYAGRNEINQAQVKQGGPVI